MEAKREGDEIVLDGVKAIGARLSGGLAQLGSAPARSNSNAGFKRRAS